MLRALTLTLHDLCHGLTVLSDKITRDVQYVCRKGKVIKRGEDEGRGEKERLKEKCQHWRH